ncbi:MAG: hypothetical protein ACJ71A_13525 [Nitrososphaeraceae archaeon]
MARKSFSADQFREDPRAHHLPDFITPSEYGVGDCPPTYNSPSITFSCFDLDSPPEYQQRF